MNDKCVVVTGTIVPNILIHGHEDWDSVKRQSQYENVNVRRCRYLETLALYAATLSEPIYFLENSSYDFSADGEFQSLFKKNNVKLLKFPVSQHVEMGKGYQEFEMLDKFIWNLSGQYQTFMKLSGRYQYRNIKTLVGFKSKGLMIDMHRKQKVAVTSIFLTTFDFYERHLIGLYLEADDRRGAWIERILYRKFSDKRFRQTVQLFPAEPDLIGLAQSGATQNDSAVFRLKRSARTLERAGLSRIGFNQLYF